jgi:hypothetical protein
MDGGSAIVQRQSRRGPHVDKSGELRLWKSRENLVLWISGENFVVDLG